jgi:hypothetical protein
MRMQNYDPFSSQLTLEATNFVNHVLPSAWLKLRMGRPAHIVWREQGYCESYIRMTIQLLNYCSALIWLLMKDYCLESKLFDEPRDLALCRIIATMNYEHPCIIRGMSVSFVFRTLRNEAKSVNNRLKKGNPLFYPVSMSVRNLIVVPVV